jgi:uncharacterized Tic20 family protein
MVYLPLRMQTIDATTLSSAEKEQHNWAMICHLSALLFFVPIIPLGNIVGPLVVWLWKRHEIPGVNEHGKAVLNFQLSLVIYFLVGCVLLAPPLVLLSFIPFAILLTIPALLLLGFAVFVAVIVAVILTIVASLRASDGQTYAYPFTLNLIR